MTREEERMLLQILENMTTTIQSVSTSIDGLTNIVKILDERMKGLEQQINPQRRHT